MARKTIIVGAGASKEVGLPTGEELKTTIAKVLDLDRQGLTTMIASDSKRWKTKNCAVLTKY